MAKTSIPQLEKYWDGISDKYNEIVNIKIDDFHYGPIIPGDSVLNLLPQQLDNKKCLEFGCGAAQNAIFLAQQGAISYASDISKTQLLYAKKIIDELDINVNLIHSPMESLTKAKLGQFDLIHSSYAISFSPDPAKVISNMAEMLVEGGTLLISTGHPLFSGEWLDIEGGEMGLFVKDYFNPVPDSRYDDNGKEIVSSNLYPISTMCDWFLDAGLFIEKISEPKPLPIKDIKKTDRNKEIPYSSNGWCELYEQFNHAPGIIIFKCRRF